MATPVLRDLNELQQRTKWKAASKEDLQHGALVVLKEDNLPTLAWKINRIQDLHLGSDGHLRVNFMKTIGGEVKCAFSQLTDRLDITFN